MRVVPSVRDMRFRDVGVKVTSAMLVLGGVGCGGEARSTDEGDTVDAAAVIDASPGAVDASVPEPGPHFFVHLSDVHIDSGAFAAPAFDYVLGTVLPSFPDVPVLVTGDLVEAGNNTDSWAYYEQQTIEAGLSPDTYVECAGNHDSLLDGDLDNYLAHSVAGRAGRGLHAQYDFTRYGQRVRVLTTNTADAGDPVRDGAGFITSGQVDDILAGVADDPTEPYATIVLGHHPKDTPDGLELLGTDEEMERLLDEADATAYLFGHSHVHFNYWDGMVLHTSAATSGNPGDGVYTDWVDPEFSLFAIDAGPSEISMPILGVPPEALHSPWPAVMITRPADRGFAAGLGSGDVNPWAVPLPRNTADNLLHAGAFAPGGVQAVYFAVDGGAEQPMEVVDGYYRARFTTPDADACEITVRAVAGGESSSQTVTVDLAP